MRKRVSKTELLRILNEELGKAEECDGCRFDGPIFELRNVEEGSVNWSDVLTVRCSGRGAGPCQDIARRVITAVGQRYNLD